MKQSSFLVLWLMGSPKWPFMGYSCIKLITHAALHLLHILKNRIKAEFFVNVFMSLNSYNKHHRLTYDLAVVSLCIALWLAFRHLQRYCNQNEDVLQHSYLDISRSEFLIQPRQKWITITSTEVSNLFIKM